MEYPFLEKHRPAQDAVLQLTMTFTRLGVGEPFFTPEVARAAELPDWPITGVAALPDALLLEVEMPLDPDFPLELAMLIGPLFYGRELGRAMFGEAAMTSAETFVACIAAKARWKGTPHWELKKRPQREEDEPLPQPILN